MKMKTKPFSILYISPEA